MAWFQNVAIGVAVVVVAMACMVFGDWLQASRKREPNYDYCQYARRPEGREVATPQVGTTPNQKEASKSANERYHELCNQWRAAEYAQEAARVAWIQLWFGIAGIVGLGLTVFFAAQSARAAGEAAQHTARSVETQIRIEQPLLVVTHIFDPAHGRAAFDVRNLGKTPAILSAFFATFDVADYLDEHPWYGRPTRILGKVLQSGEGDQFTSVVKPDDSQAIYDYQETAFFWGYLRYEDVFGRTRTVGFGFSGHPMTDDDGNVVGGLLWSRAGGDAYNYDREEDPEKS